MRYVAQTADGQEVGYVDRKRYLWMVVWLSPLVPMLTMALYFVSGKQPWVLFGPLFYLFVCVPALDGWFGEDINNPPDAVVPLLVKDNYYRFVLFMEVVLNGADFMLMVWFVGTQTIPWWAYVAFALGGGVTTADMVFVCHELGHKRRTFDRVLNKIGLAWIGYGHFTMAHNRAHHVQVATPLDHASSRMGESVYRFALREMPGVLWWGWKLEKERLAQLGHGTWSVHNDILQSWALSTVLTIAFCAAFGWIVLPFIAIHHLYAQFGATQANYIEHYGLMRQKLANGRYELPEPRHSWNTNHIYSNLITLHVQRHSDHHVNPTRPYQALRDYKNLPRLPSGYPGCFGLAAIPSLWFKVMDEKLMEWCGGDLNQLNIDPKKRAALFAKYGVVDRSLTEPNRTGHVERSAVSPAKLQSEWTEARAANWDDPEDYEDSGEVGAAGLQMLAAQCAAEVGAQPRR